MQLKSLFIVCVQDFVGDALHQITCLICLKLYITWLRNISKCKKRSTNKHIWSTALFEGSKLLQFFRNGSISYKIINFILNLLTCKVAVTFNVLIRPHFFSKLQEKKRKKENSMLTLYHLLITCMLFLQIKCLKPWNRILVNRGVSNIS